MIYFTSDQHFGHRNVIKYCHRPFRTKNPFLRLREWITGEISQKSVEVMNRELIRRHNSVVKPEDTVYHLGDFSMHHSKTELLKQLNGRHVLVAGNHDRCHTVMCKSKNKREKMVQFYMDAGFYLVSEEFTFQGPGYFFKLHHMPYSGDQTEKDRYLEYRPKDEGGWLLHGHVHNAWKTKGRQINVGVDVWNYYPVSLNQILELVKNES